MVKLKLAFMEGFFYNLVILIKLYKILYLNSDKALFAWKIENFDEVFFNFANNSRCKQNKKNPEHCFVDIDK